MDKYDKPTASWLKNPWLYIAVTFVWTWGFWGLGVLLGITMTSPYGIVIGFMGVIGPMVTGIGFTYLTKNKTGQRDYWWRVIDFKRIGLKWLLIVLLFTPILNSLSALIDFVLGGTGAVWGESITTFTTNPMALVLSLVFASLTPFIEELGWRGYLLDRFQEKRSALMASLIIGLAWALWHLPLFFIEGTYQASLGIGTQAFWLFNIAIIPLSFVFTWVYNNTQYSILAAFLLHAMVNFTGELFDITPRANTISTFLWIVAALGITLFWGAKSFTHQSAEQLTKPAQKVSV
jgi:uncharacterized protein